MLNAAVKLCTSTKQINTKHKPKTNLFLEYYVFQVTNMCHESLYIQSSSSSPVIATQLQLSAQDHHCFKMLLKGSCFAREEYEIDLYEAIDQLNNLKIGNIILSQENKIFISPTIQQTKHLVNTFTSSPPIAPGCM